MNDFKPLLNAIKAYLADPERRKEFEAWYKKRFGKEFKEGNK